MAIAEFATEYRPKPGRRSDALALMSRTAKVVERLGSADNRLLVAGPAGEVTGVLRFVSQFEAHDAFGRFSDVAAEDDEWLALQDAVGTADSPVSLEGQTLAMQVLEGCEQNPGRGTVVEKYISVPKEGKFKQSLELGAMAFDFVQGHGARNGKIFYTEAAGKHADVLFISWEFDDMEAHCRAADSYRSDPRGEALMELTASPEWPNHVISSLLYRQLAL